MNVICVLSVVYALGKACVCVVRLSNMVDDVTRGRRMVLYIVIFVFLAQKKSILLAS